MCPYFLLIFWETKKTIKAKAKEKAKKEIKELLSRYDTGLSQNQLMQIGGISE